MRNLDEEEKLSKYLKRLILIELNSYKDLRVY